MITIQDLKDILQKWENKSVVDGWHNIEYLCYQIFKITDTVNIELISQEEGRLTWRYIFPNQLTIVCEVDITCNGWYMSVFLEDIPLPSKYFECIQIDLPDADHWTKVWTLVSQTLQMFDSLEDIQIALEEIEDIQNQNIDLFNYIDARMPQIVDAYVRIRGYKPFLRALSASYTDTLPPEGKIAAYERFGGVEGDCCGIIGICTRAIDRGSKYLRYVIDHELIHYLLNTQKGYDPHNQEFQLIASLLNIPLKYQD